MNKKFKEFCDKKLEHPFYHNMITLKSLTKDLVILLGPNGSGKSMSMMNLEQECKRKKINYIKYSTKQNDIVLKASNPFKMDLKGMSCAFHSEGERMCDSFYDWCNSIMLKELLTKETDLYILIDEADSGLSIDRLKESLEQLVHILELEKQKHPNRIVKFIFTCNSYEMYEIIKTKDSKTIWLPTKEEISPRTYSQFKQRYVEYYEYMNRY